MSGVQPLLLLDELGYVQIDPRCAELLFQVITFNAHILETGTPVLPAPHQQSHNPNPQDRLNSGPNARLSFGPSHMTALTHPTSRS